MRHHLSPAARRVRDYLKENDGTAEMALDAPGVPELARLGLIEPVNEGVVRPFVVLTPYGEAHTGDVVVSRTALEWGILMAVAAVFGSGAYFGATLAGFPGLPAALAFAVVFAAIAALRPF